MIVSKLLAMTPFAMAGLLAEMQSPSEYVQYGALGICAFSAYMLFRQLSDIRAVHAVERASLVLALEQQNTVHRQERRDLVADLQRKDDLLIEILQRNIKSNATLAQALHDRPCLHDDARVEIED